MIAQRQFCKTIATVLERSFSLSSVNITRMESVVLSNGRRQLNVEHDLFNKKHSFSTQSPSILYGVSITYSVKFIAEVQGFVNTSSATIYLQTRLNTSISSGKFINLLKSDNVTILDRVSSIHPIHLVSLPLEILLRSGSPSSQPISAISIPPIAP